MCCMLPLKVGIRMPSSAWLCRPFLPHLCVLSSLKEPRILLSHHSRHGVQTHSLALRSRKRHWTAYAGPVPRARHPNTHLLDVPCLLTWLPAHRHLYEEERCGPAILLQPLYGLLPVCVRHVLSGFVYSLCVVHLVCDIRIQACWLLSTSESGITSSRFLVMYAYGGIYVDADIVLRSPITHLRNALSFEDGMLTILSVSVFLQACV